MVSINEIKPRSKLKGLSSKESVATVISVETIGGDALQIVFEDQDGQINNRVLFSDELHEIEILSEGQFWTFDADGNISTERVLAVLDHMGIDAGMNREALARANSLLQQRLGKGLVQYSDYSAPTAVAI